MMLARNTFTKSARGVVAISSHRSLSYMNDVLDESVRKRMFTAAPGEVDPLEETARSALAKSCYQNIQWKISENAPGKNKISVLFNIIM